MLETTAREPRLLLPFLTGTVRRLLATTGDLSEDAIAALEAVAEHVGPGGEGAGLKPGTQTARGVPGA